MVISVSPHYTRSFRKLFPLKTEVKYYMPLAGAFNPYAMAFLNLFQTRPLNNKHLMKKKQLLILSFILLAIQGFSQTNFFTPVPQTQLPAAKASMSGIARKGTFRLNDRAIRTYLRSARMEFR